MRRVDEVEEVGRCGFEGEVSECDLKKGGRGRVRSRGMREEASAVKCRSGSSTEQSGRERTIE